MTRSENMEHVEVLRDLSEVCRAAIKAGDWKVDGACDPDSLLRHADAAIASLSAPQPPAEAQPDREPADWPHQDWKGMDGATAWLLINRHASGWEAVGEMMDAWLSANSEQPPSAPVGVEAGWYRYNKPAPRWEDTKFGKWLDPAVYGPPREQHGYSLEVTTLAQQPAPVAPVGVEGLPEKWRREAPRARVDVGEDASLAWREAVYWCAFQLEAALAQKPAAVDGDKPYPAPRNRQEAAALAKLALAYLGVTSAHIDAVVARCETDLAAQQGGAK